MHCCSMYPIRLDTTSHVLPSKRASKNKNTAAGPETKKGARVPSVASCPPDNPSSCHGALLPKIRGSFSPLGVLTKVRLWGGGMTTTVGWASHSSDTAWHGPALPGQIVIMIICCRDWRGASGCTGTGCKKVDRRPAAGGYGNGRCFQKLKTRAGSGTQQARAPGQRPL